ncbi:MAG: hypothetical protein AB1486_24705 [Planctomycetota bacterium]
MVVMKGEVDQLISGSFLNMRAVETEVPDGTRGGTQRNDFVYLEKGTENAVNAGPDGAEILEVHARLLGSATVPPDRNRQPDSEHRGGMQNGGMATGIAIEVLKSTRVALAPAIFGPWMNVSGSVLASWWRCRPPRSGSRR